MDRYEEHCANLKEAVRGFVKEDVALAFSGGVDSSLLLNFTRLGMPKLRRELPGKREPFTVSFMWMNFPMRGSWTIRKTGVICARDICIQNC